MSFPRLLIAVHLAAVLGSEASAQSYGCVADTSDETIGLRLDVVSWVTGTDPRVVAKRNALQLLPATLSQVIAGQRKVNDILEGTKLPRISDEVIHNIIYENWKRFLPEYA